MLKPNGLGLAFADLVQDHRSAETLQVRQHLLSFLIEFDVAIFERMIDDLAGLVMLDVDRRLGTSAIAAPLDVSGGEVFGALQPLEADHGDRRRLDLTVLDAAMSEGVDLVSAGFFFFTRVFIMTPTQGFGTSFGNLSGKRRRTTRQALRQSTTSFAPAAGAHRSRAR